MVEGKLDEIDAEVVDEVKGCLVDGTSRSAPEGLPQVRGESS